MLWFLHNIALQHGTGMSINLILLLQNVRSCFQIVTPFSDNVLVSRSISGRVPSIAETRTKRAEVYQRVLASNQYEMRLGGGSGVANPKKSSLTLPIANMLPTSLLVPMSLMRRCVPFSITWSPLSVYCGGVALGSHLISAGMSYQ
jgi:hypothetical protein